MFTSFQATVYVIGAMFQLPVIVGGVIVSGEHVIMKN
jgi:hypothetical protein